jgi:hypothetical protein
MRTVRGERECSDSCQEENQNTQDTIVTLTPEQSMRKQWIRLYKSDDKSPSWEVFIEGHVNFGNAT